MFNYFDLEDQAAAIAGPGLLRDTSLAIDFAGQKLYLGPTVAGREPPRPSRTQVEVYDPDARNGVNGHAPSGTESCPWQGSRC